MKHQDDLSCSLRRKCSKMFPVATGLVHLLLLAQCSEFSFASPRVRSSWSFCAADKNENWTYRGDNGPMFWGKTYPTCYEDSQSPIEIISTDAVKDANLAKLELVNYDIPVSSATIENNGHTIELIPNDGVDRSINIGGSNYKLHQLHFHWGKVFFKGSEHVLDGVRYTMEMHLVHLNEERQIAVVGVFFRERSKVNDDLQSIVKELRNLRYKGTETKLNSNLNLNNLLPENPASYYRYNGSLTTPECHEGVIWSVLPGPLTVGKSQMAEFRKLYSATQREAHIGCTLSNNYRPVQPLNGRQVYLSA